MNQIILWVAVIASVIYGALTAFAGFGQIKNGKIQVWAAWGMILCGLVLLAAGVLALVGSPAALWLLVVGLLGIHALTINNGLKMFGKINPSHHLVRLIISVILILLMYTGTN